MTSEPDHATGMQRTPLWRRLGLLIACLGSGLGVGYVGWHFTADQRWYLAVPIALLLGWLAVADPAQCTPARDRAARGRAPR